MKYDHLGRSNLVVSKVCLGTMSFGEYTDQAEAFRIMDRCLELGINFFDAANVYGVPKGHTEEIIGNWFAQGGGRREKVVLATKVSETMYPGQMIPNEGSGVSAIKVRKHLENSLRRLQTDHIDLYQVHHIDRRVSVEEFWGTMQATVSRGQVSYIGTSNFPGWALAKYQMAARERGILGIVSEQLMYNLLCRYPEMETIPAAKDFGVGLMCYMPLAGGLLTGKKSAAAGSRTDRAAHHYYGRALGEMQLAQLEGYSKLCAELGEKENVVAAAWTLANPAVTCAVLGARTTAHLDDVERIVNLKLEADFLKKLDELFDVNKGRPIQKGEAPDAFAW